MKRNESTVRELIKISISNVGGQNPVRTQNFTTIVIDRKTGRKKRIKTF